MAARLFHIYRNTPSGRENLLQSAYFCRMVDAAPVVYLPKFTRFLMYFENDVVQVDLDDSYLTAPDTAQTHAAEILADAGLDARFFTAKNHTASTLPDIPVDFDYMCCPRSISDLSSKFGLGYIGSRVRRIVRSAKFPVLIPSTAFKPWKSVTVFFGGSENAVNALRQGFQVARQAGVPLDLVTQLEGGMKKADYETVLDGAGLGGLVADQVRDWHLFSEGKFEENLFTVPHDALLVMGAFGHGLIRDVIFGSKMEKIQSVMPNSMLIAGPRMSLRAV